MQIAARTGNSRRLVAGGILASLVGLVLSAAPASAGGTDGGEETDTGYGVGASQVTLTGDVSASLRASVPSPPPLCYWKPLTFPGVDATDPKAVKKYYFDELRAFYTSSTAGPGYYAWPNGDASFDQAIDAEKGGDITWYELEVNDSQLSSDYGERVGQLRAAGCGSGFTPLPPEYGGGVLVTYNYFPAGNPPAPVVDPEILAQYAYEVMDLVEPTLQWNPKIQEMSNASLVNLPTWMWVDDTEAIDERSVTATAGSVSATVTATTGGLSITSPAGTVQCSPDEAVTSYGPGISEAAACTITFTRASRGYPDGFPMAASTEWEASWTASTGDSGDLDGRNVSETTYVPVVESQSLVNSVR